MTEIRVRATLDVLWVRGLSGGPPVVSQFRDMIVCALWSSGDSSARAVGTAMTLVIRSEILQVSCLCKSACEK